MLSVKELKEIVRNTNIKDEDGLTQWEEKDGFRLVLDLASDWGYFSDRLDLSSLPFKIVDSSVACHDGQEGEVVIQFNNDSRFFATDHTYSSWGSGWLGENLREVKPRQEVITVWDNVKDENT